MDYYYQPKKEKLPERESKDILRKKRISQKEIEARGRRAVVILFLITIGLSLSFWLREEIPLFLKKITAPYQVTIEKKEVKK